MNNIFNKTIDSLTEEDLADLVKEKVAEGQYIEYKREFVDNISLAKEIAAFANAQGGWLFIGVAEDPDGIAQDICGFTPGEGKNPKRDTNNKILDVVYSHIAPTPVIQTKVLKLANKNKLAAVRIKEGWNTPYTVNGTVYSRVHSSANPVKEAYALHQIINKRDKHTNQIEAFSINPIDARRYKNQTTAELYLYIDPPIDFTDIEKESAFNEESFRYLIQASTTKRILLQNLESAGTKIQIVGSSFEAWSLKPYLLDNRQDENFPVHPGTVFEFYFNGWAKIILPLSEYNFQSLIGTECLPTYDKHWADFKKILLNKYSEEELASLPMIDGYNSCANLRCVILQYEDILKNHNYKGNIAFRLRLNNPQNRIIYLDDKDYLAFCKEEEVVVNHKNTIEIPGFMNGKLMTLTRQPKDLSDLYLPVDYHLLSALGVDVNLFSNTPASTGFRDYMQRAFNYAKDKGS